MEIRFDTYYDNAELDARLRFLADAHPALATLSSLGHSFEGRDVPLMTLTNTGTGPDTDKPGFWIDGNIHATELTASAAALYAIDTVLQRYTDGDAHARRLLDENVLYVAPRLNPDGADLALADSPRYLRSGTRPYPRGDREDGLHSSDIDGDGRILQMRLPDPSGDWVASEKDPRLLVKRRPDEQGGTYYRLLPEGLVQGFDGHLIDLAPPLEGLDFNRNFPGNWRPEGEQRGAGDHPGSEPEIRAVMEFVAAHPNLFGAITFHTFSRAILRPYGTKADEDMPTEDLWIYEAVGERGTELTGYPCVSVFHHFKYHPKELIGGVFDDWLYAHKGIFAYTIELWDLATAAGITEKNDDKKFIEWFRKHSREDEHKILEFVNQHAPDGLVEWYPFEHPQLGTVELGGWDTLYTWRNPPPSLLKDEIKGPVEFALTFAGMGPRLGWRALETTGVGDDHRHVLAVVENTGFLATSVSEQAMKMKACRPVRWVLELPDGASLASGKPRGEIGHLQGRSNKLYDTSMWSPSVTDNRGKVEWLIHAPSGGVATLTIVSERAGTLRTELDLR